MKFRSLLTIFLVLPFVVMGQNSTVKKADNSSKVKTAKDSATLRGDITPYADPDDPRTFTEKYTAEEPIIFFNTGAIYFGANKESAANATKNPGAVGTEANQVMRVEGSMQSLSLPDNDPDKKLKMINNSALVLSGDLINFQFDISDADFQKGAVWFRQPTDAEKLPLYGVTSKVNMAESMGDGDKMKLRKIQKIIGYNIIPNIVVDTFSYVSLEPSQDLLADIPQTVLSLGDYKTGAAGLLSVRGGGIFNYKTEYSRTKLRHMHAPVFTLNKPVLTWENTPSQGSGKKMKGQVMHEMEVYNHRDEGTLTAGAIGTNSVPLKKNITDSFKFPIKNPGAVKMVSPFVTPFKGLGADYLFFNLLTKPHGLSIGGGAEGPIVNPAYIVEGGKPYFTALDAGRHDYDEITGNWSVPEDSRSIGGYHFNRTYYLNQTPRANFNQFKSDNSIFDKETFSTLSEAENITYRLVNGMNYIANPYTAPLSYSDLVKLDGANKRELTKWQAPGSVVPLVVDDLNAVSDADKQRAIRSKVWFPSEGTIQYFEDLNAKSYYFYAVKYFDDQTVGGTWIQDSHVMGPLTVFAVQYNGKVMDIRIPKDNIVLPSKTVGGEVIVTPRSGVEELKDKVEERIDEVLLEATTYDLTFAANEEDAQPSVVDRVSVVLREDASFAYASRLKKDDRVDTQKLLSMYDPASISDMNYSLKGARSGDSFKNALEKLPGSLYTVSSDGVALATSAVPSTAKQVPIYFTPTSERSKVVIKPYRLETLASVSKAWLVDRFKDNAVVELTPETEYEFISEPISAELAQENRFILLFDYTPDDGTIVEQDLPIICYYNSSTLFIEQLMEKDLGSKVQVYDLQGRLIGNTKITDYPIMNYSLPLASGAYIVRITGERNLKTKIMALP